VSRQSITLDLDATIANAAPAGKQQPAAAPDPSRRAFLGRLGLGAAAVAGCALLNDVQHAAASGDPAGDPDEAEGMLIDLARCSGCQACALACKAANNMPEPEIVPTALNSSALSFVDVRIAERENENYAKRQCMHCLHPACVSACTVGALRKTAAGPVVYDAGKCIGCRYCQYACPFGVPTYQWDNVLGLIRKCELCAGQRDAAGRPACVAACPNGALRFGKRHELLAQAKAQIASRPEQYVDHVYGEHEVGGTSMLYLSDVPFSLLGFPTLGDATISGSAETVMQLTPAVAATVATLATGLHLIMRRRQQVAEFALQEAQQKNAHKKAAHKKEGGA
jgi:formate dehydrogenase iron-sulfur subunit